MNTEDDKEYEKKLKRSQRLTRMGNYTSTRLVARYLGVVTGLAAVVVLFSTFSDGDNNAIGISTAGGVVVSFILAGITYFLFTGTTFTGVLRLPIKRDSSRDLSIMNQGKIGEIYCFIGVGSKINATWSYPIRCGAIVSIRYEEEIKIITIKSFDDDQEYDIFDHPYDSADQIRTSAQKTSPSKPIYWIPQKHYLTAHKIIDPIRRHVPFVLRLFISMSLLGLYYLSLLLIFGGMWLCFAWFIVTQLNFNSGWAALIAVVPTAILIAVITEPLRRFDNSIRAIEYINDAIL
ncbi:hypothetical protein ACFL17_08595 [Pseudomonadota bacterium]